MLPVAEENKKILIVEPAVADAITGDKWNRYIFRTGRNSTQDASTAPPRPFRQAGDVSVATLAQDYAFGRDGVAAFKDGARNPANAKVVFEEYAPQNATDFTAVGAAPLRRAEGQAGHARSSAIIWAGAAIRCRRSPT